MRELPFGKGKRYLHTGRVFPALAGGWQLNLNPEVPVRAVGKV
jgi:hypothetical protein